MRLALTLFSLLLLSQVIYPQTNIGGLGIRLAIDEDSKFPYISEVIKGMPAEQMNLAPLDFIIKINGKSTYNYSTEQVVFLLKGTVGTTCDITVWRDKVEYPLTFTRAKLSDEKITLSPSCYSNAHG